MESSATAAERVATRSPEGTPSHRAGGWKILSGKAQGRRGLIRSQLMQLACAHDAIEDESQHGVYSAALLPSQKRFRGKAFRDLRLADWRWKLGSEVARRIERSACDLVTLLVACSCRGADAVDS